MISISNTSKYGDREFDADCKAQREVDISLDKIPSIAKARLDIINKLELERLLVLKIFNDRKQRTINGAKNAT